MAAKVVNQNDLNEIIKSNIENINYVLDSVKIIIESCKQINAAQIKNINKAFSSIKKIFEDASKLYTLIKDSVFIHKPINKEAFRKSIIGFKNILADIQTMSIDISNVKISIFTGLKIIAIQFFLLQIIWMIINLSRFAMVLYIAKLLNLKYLVTIMHQILTVINMLACLKLTSLILMPIKIKMLKSIVFKLFNVLFLLSLPIPIKRSLNTLFLLITYIIVLKNFITHISDIKLSLIDWFFIKYKIKKIIKLINLISILMFTLNQIPFNLGRQIKTIMQLSIFVLLLRVTITTLKNIKTGWFLMSRLKKIIRAVITLRKIVRIVNRIKITNIIKAVTVLISLNYLLITLSSILLMLIILTPVLLVFTIISPLLILGIWLFAKVVQIILKIVSVLLKPKTILGILGLVLIVTAFTLVALAFAILAQLAKSILEGLGDIFLFLLALIAIVAVMLVVGLLLGLLIIALPFVLLGIAVMFIMVTAIFIIALELYLLQYIELDEKLINKNVETVIRTAFSIIDAIFNQIVEIGGGGKNESWFEKILHFIGGSAVTFITVILSVVFLAYTVVAIGLILFIAFELRLLQTLDLLPEKINLNVKTVLATAQMVIDSIFDKNDDKEDKPSSKGFFIQLIEYCSGDLVDLITAIMAVGYLALMVVAVGLILFIATELRLLQILDLQPDLIVANVSTVISTAQMVMGSVFDPSDDKEDKPSSKGFFLDLINFFNPGLAEIVEAIMAIGYLALTVVAISLIMAIAKQLEYIAGLNLDAETIRKNTDTVIKTAKHVIDAVIRPDDSKPKSAKDVFKKILRMVLPGNLLDMIDALMAIGFLALAKSAVGLVGEIAQNLTTIAKLPSMNGITGKVDTIVNTSRSVINKIINNGGGISKKDAEKLSNTGNYIGKLINTIRIVGNLSREVNNVQTTNKEKVARVQQSIDLVAGLVDSIAAKSKSDVKVTDKKLHQMNYMMNVIERINKISAVDVQNSEAVLKNYSQFIDKVSNSNLDNLKTTTHMFAKMAEFSKSIHGDFDALADTINEKIAPLLEDLKKIMEDVHTKIEKTGSDISSSVYASSQGSLSPDEMSKQIEREMPNSSKEEQQKALQKKLEEQAQRQNNNIVDKLDELINLFEYGTAKVRTF